MSRRQANVVITACIVTLLLAVLDINVVTTTATAIARDIDPRSSPARCCARRPPPCPS
jgi:hypothetical protein